MYNILFFIKINTINKYIFYQYYIDHQYRNKIIIFYQVKKYFQLNNLLSKY